MHNPIYVSNRLNIFSWWSEDMQHLSNGTPQVSLMGSTLGKNRKSLLETECVPSAVGTGPP